MSFLQWKNLPVACACANRIKSPVESRVVSVTSPSLHTTNWTCQVLNERVGTWRGRRKLSEVQSLPPVLGGIIPGQTATDWVSIPSRITLHEATLQALQRWTALFALSCAVGSSENKPPLTLSFPKVFSRGCSQGPSVCATAQGLSGLFEHFRQWRKKCNFLSPVSTHSKNLASIHYDPHAWYRTNKACGIYCEKTAWQEVNG